MNSICLTGRLTRDPEFRTGNDLTIVKFTLAVDLGKDKTMFIPCTVFGQTAEVIGKNTRKGHQVAICGKLSQDTVEKETGEKTTYTYVIVNSFDFLEKKEESVEQAKKPATTPEEIYEELSATADDDLPF